MSETEATAESPAPAAPAPKPAAAKPPARDLPSQDEIAAWIRGGDCPKLGALFDLPLAKFDALRMQIDKQELLPQHWQPFPAGAAAPDAGAFERLPETGRLRLLYRDQELSRRRLEALKAAWIELRGKQSSVWKVADVFAAMRRLIERKIAVDFTELLTAVRDVWAGMSVPAGREQLDQLWIVLAFVRDKSK